MKATINNSIISINPSKKLVAHIHSMKNYNDMPLVFNNIRSKKDILNNESLHDCPDLLSKEDFDFIETLNLQPTTLCANEESCQNEELGIKVEDLIWLWNKMQDENQSTNDTTKLYLHEMLEGSNILLPENDEIPRNKVLDKRCQLLQAQQENRAYKAMTKNVDNIRKPLPEDTIAYQMKQINTQLIAVAQFIISVLAGFAFGFLGVELLAGTLDFGFRLLLGIICSLVIALAELYFLAKKLNEDLAYEIKVDNKIKHSKMD